MLISGPLLVNLGQWTRRRCKLAAEAAKRGRSVRWIAALGWRTVLRMVDRHNRRCPCRRFRFWFRHERFANLVLELLHRNRPTTQTSTTCHALTPLEVSLGVTATFLETPGKTLCTIRSLPIAFYMISFAVIAVVLRSGCFPTASIGLFGDTAWAGARRRRRHHIGDRQHEAAAERRECHATIGRWSARKQRSRFRM
jgi:hypothetical protein